MFKGINKLSRKPEYEELSSSIHINTIGYEALIFVTSNMPLEQLKDLDLNPVMRTIEKRYDELEADDRKAMTNALDALGVDYEIQSTVRITH